ncbi:uncharacterized protein METZ01_LOCUS317437, partial [marine metagenome]
AVLPIKDFQQNKFVFMATRQGTIKKTPLSAYSRPIKTGIKAIKLKEGDTVVNVEITEGDQEIMLFSDAGKAIRFSEKDARPMGRVSQGVRGMRIEKKQNVISLIVANEGNILTATENGFGKQTPIKDFTLQKRGGKGVIAIQTSKRNGKLIAANQVQQDDEVMFISSIGNLIRTAIDNISVIGRNTQGVKLISLSDDDKLLGMERIINDNNDDE